MMELLEDIVGWFEDMGDALSDFFDEVSEFSFEDTDFYMDMEDACAAGAMSCVDFFTDQPAEYVAMAIVTFFIILFILLRIFHLVFRDTEVW